jgi:hypothetical protein
VGAASGSEGGFNLRHDLWVTDDVYGSSEAEGSVAWVNSHWSTLLNQKGVIACERVGQTSVLDLTWANEKVLLISGWSVWHELAVGSDHLPATRITPLSGSYP